MFIFIVIVALLIGIIAFLNMAGERSKKKKARKKADKMIRKGKVTTEVNKVIDDLRITPRDPTTYSGRKELPEKDRERIEKLKELKKE